MLGKIQYHINFFCMCWEINYFFNHVWTDFWNLHAQGGCPWFGWGSVTAWIHNDCCRVLYVWQLLHGKDLTFREEDVVREKTDKSRAYIHFKKVTRWVIVRTGRMDSLFIGITCIVLKDVLDSSDVTYEKYCVIFYKYSTFKNLHKRILLQLVLSTGSGVNGFTLDPSLGEFILTHPSIKVHILCSGYENVLFSHIECLVAIWLLLTKW